MLERSEARKAFEYLNKVRKDPARFGKEIGVDLVDVNPRDALVWNDILARVAEEKALDMATRNYFGHVTPDGLGMNIKMHEAGYALLPDWELYRGFDQTVGRLGCKSTCRDRLSLLWPVQESTSMPLPKSMARKMPV